MVAHEGEITHAGVLEAGMTSGKPSVGFYTPLPDGTVVFSQTSADILRAVLAAADAINPPARSN